MEKENNQEKERTTTGLCELSYKNGVPVLSVTQISEN